MKFGDKPLNEMTKEETLEAIATLRNSREALRAEGVKKFKEEKAAKAVRATKKEIKAVKEETNAEALRLLMGE